MKNSENLNLFWNWHDKAVQSNKGDDVMIKTHGLDWIGLEDKFLYIFNNKMTTKYWTWPVF